MTAMRLLFAIAALCALAAAQDPAPRARAAVKELGERIRSLLAAELAAGGFEGAVGVCAQKAQEETRRYATEHGIRIRRVSLKARNPLNRPAAWEDARLRQWEAALKDGASLPEFAEENAPGGAYRLMVPIRVQAMCLTCHGDPAQIPATVRAIIARHYPEDAATGYRAGDLRGAFSVEIPR